MWRSQGKSFPIRKFRIARAPGHNLHSKQPGGPACQRSGHDCVRRGLGGRRSLPEARSKLTSLPSRLMCALLISLLRRLWPAWTNVLVIVTPETVVAWHPACFRSFWRSRSRTNDRGTPIIDAAILLIKTPPRCALFHSSRTSLHVWFHSRAWSACIIGTTGSNLPEEDSFLVRITSRWQGSVPDAVSETCEHLHPEKGPGFFANFPTIPRFRDHQQQGAGLVATDSLAC